MVPWPRLPKSFNGCFFGSSHNVNGIEKYLLLPPIGCVPPNVILGGYFYVFEMRLDHSASRLVLCFPSCPQSKQSVGLKEKEDVEMVDGSKGNQVFCDYSMKKTKGWNWERRVALQRRRPNSSACKCGKSCGLWSIHGKGQVFRRYFYWCDM